MTRQIFIGRLLTLLGSDFNYYTEFSMLKTNRMERFWFFFVQFLLVQRKQQIYVFMRERIWIIGLHESTVWRVHFGRARRGFLISSSGTTTHVVAAYNTSRRAQTVGFLASVATTIMLWLFRLQTRFKCLLAWYSIPAESWHTELLLALYSGIWHSHELKHSMFWRRIAEVVAVCCSVVPYNCLTSPNTCSTMYGLQHYYTMMNGAAACVF